MPLRLAGIGSPEVKIGQLSQENVSSSANSASFRANVTDHSGIVTGDSGQNRKSVTFNQNSVQVRGRDARPPGAAAGF